MKALITAASALALCAVIPAVASAQTFASPTFYGTLGYDETSLNHVNLGGIQGRVGARFGQYFGVEGEAAWGVQGNKATIGGTSTNVNLNSQEALYGVTFLPISPNLDLLARIGYGHTDTSGTINGVAAGPKGDSWNFGVGGQYTFDGKNGVRVDYTREDFQDHASPDAGVWSIAYVRKF
ncbi:MAG TPA: porin family protein [Phenylobacterium sp.]|jgi:hypothetical protein|nr:porin family protein [Phenylobacterium sp.]